MTSQVAREPMLEIRDLHASAGDQPVLKGIDLVVRRGEVHAVMGPNGSGKSTLAHVLAGKPGYEITRGEIRFEGRDLAVMSPEERAREGVFLAFQYPVEIPGVSNMYFLKQAVNAVRAHRGLEELDAMEFLQLARDRMKLVDMTESLTGRGVNEGFSGGEKKRNEVLQMALLDPKLCILDETDSGLDIDALRVVAAGVNSMRGPARAMLVITHYQRLLEYVVPDFVHVLSGGRIVKSGGKELARELEERGYGWVQAAPGGAQPANERSERAARRSRAEFIDPDAERRSSGSGEGGAA
jgi:Fe-S cluster assembly ATP-binding protein